MPDDPRATPHGVPHSRHVPWIGEHVGLDQRIMVGIRRGEPDLTPRKGLKDGNAKGVPSAMADKLRKLLFALETAETPEQVGRFPGWKLHPLKGELRGSWSLTVTGNWRLVFRYDEQTNTASDIDLIDYH